MAFARKKHMYFGYKPEKGRRKGKVAMYRKNINRC